MTDIQSITPDDREQFLQDFLVCMLWCTTEGDSGNLDDNHSLLDIHPDTRTALAEHCNTFINANAADLLQAIDSPQGYDFGQAGHDFMLSSNGHGAGFFDRGLGEVGERLQEAARAAGPTEAYAGDDGKVYVMGMEEPRPSGKSPAPGR